MIFHDLPAGDRPLVRMPLQKVLVRFHYGSSDTLSDCFIFDAVLHCIFFVACFCFPGVVVSLLQLKFGDFVIG